MSSRNAIAQALLSQVRPNPIQSFNQDAYGPGLQHPAFDPVMLMANAGAPAMAKALTGMAETAPGMMASEAGALFPEGAPLPLNDREAMKELAKILPESQYNDTAYLTNINRAAKNLDWPSVLADKWKMLAGHTSGY